MYMYLYTVRGTDSVHNSTPSLLTHICDVQEVFLFVLSVTLSEELHKTDIHAHTQGGREGGREGGRKGGREGEGEKREGGRGPKRKCVATNDG